MHFYYSQKMSLPIPVLTSTEPIGTIGLPSTPSKTAKPVPYSQFDCEDTLLTADQILTRWRSDRIALAKAINPVTLPNPWTGIISRDSECLCRAGTLKKPFLSAGTCTGCGTLSRLFKYGEITTSAPIMVQVGEYTGMRLVVTHLRRGVNIGYGLSGYKQTVLPAVLGSRLLDDLATYQACEESLAANVQDTQFWACQGSPVDHYVLISCFLENELRKDGIPTTPVLKWVFECQGDVNMVEEVPSLGKGTLAEITAIPEYVESPRSPTARSSPVLPLTTEVSRGLLLQLVSTLRFLSRYAFTHGTPSLASLGFSKTPAAYIYDGVTIASPITLRLIPGSSTSLSATGGPPPQVLRLYYPGTLFAQSTDISLLPKIEVEPFFNVKRPSEGCVNSTDPAAPTVLSNPCLPEYVSRRVICYRVGDADTKTRIESLPSPEKIPHLPSLIKERLSSTVVEAGLGPRQFSFASYVRHLGIPLFHSSFDLYAFWTALMCEEAFYLAVHNDQILIDTWRQLFDISEYEGLMADIQRVRHRRSEGSLSADEILTLLSKRHLRCDALEHTWGTLKDVFSKT